MSATPGEDRNAFLGRIRSVLGRDRTEAPPAPPAVDEALVRLAGPDEDLLTLFTKQAEAVGLVVHRLSDAGLDAKLRELLGQLKVGSAMVGIADQALAGRVRQVLEQASVEEYDWTSSPDFDPQYDVDAGITDVHAALAETGSLICCSDRRHGRGLSLIPPTHLALVRSRDVLPDMIDYWARLKGLPGAELPSSQVFVTGPSKTADIEGQLVTGVHGPGEVHILLLEDV